MNILLSENIMDIRQLSQNAVELTERSNQILANNKDNIDQLFEDLKSVFQKVIHYLQI